MKRVANSVVLSAATCSSASRTIGTRPTPVMHQVQRPDLLFETNGAGFTDSPVMGGNATAGSPAFFSQRYKPSAPAADLQHTAIDSGLGTNNLTDPYVRTVGNAMPNPAGPISTVMSSIPTAAGAAGNGFQKAAVVMNSPSSDASSRRRELSIEEICQLEKGAFTLTEWVGMASTPTMMAATTTPATNPQQHSQAEGGNPSNNAPTANNGLLKVYIENFLKIDTPLPVSPHVLSAVATFESHVLPTICNSNNNNNDTLLSSVLPRWKQITEQFTAFGSSNQSDANAAPTVVEKNLLSPERFLQQLEVVQREALFYMISIGGGNGVVSVNEASSTSDLMSAVSDEVVAVVKAFLTIAIEARNNIVDAELVQLVTNSKLFDEGNAVWRVLLRTFDAEKKSIFVSLAPSASPTDVLLADSPQLAMYEWVMTHDRPLPKMTAPVALLFLLAATRCVTAANTPQQLTASNGKSPKENEVLDEADRSGIAKMKTLNRLAFVTDEIKASVVNLAIDELFGTQQTISKKDNKNKSSSSLNGKIFLQQLRLAGFDVELLQQVELQLVKANQQRLIEQNRFKTVAGSSDVGAMSANGEQQQQGDDNNNNNNKSLSNNVSSAQLTKSAKLQITPILTLFANGKGTASLFQQVYKDLSGAKGSGAGASSTLANSEKLLMVSRALGFGVKADNIHSVLNMNNPKFAQYWATHYKSYCEAIATDQRLLEVFIASLKQLLIGNAQISEGIVSREGLRLLESRLSTILKEGNEDALRSVETRRILTARHNVGRVLECAAAAGADVSSIFRYEELREKFLGGGSALAVAASAANDTSLVQQLGSNIIALHPEWATAGVLPSESKDFTPSLLTPIAAHIFVRLSYIPHTTLALLKRNYRGRVGEVFIPKSSLLSSSTPQPRNQNVPVELGKVEFYDGYQYKRNDPQGWYQRMKDINNRNVSVKVDIRDLRVVTDDFSVRSEQFGNGPSSSTPAAAAGSSTTDSPNPNSGKQIYFGLQQERRLRILAGDRVGMGIIKLDADRYEDQSDNESYGVLKLQQLLSDAKKTELGKAYWPTVEVKVRNPSGQSKSMQSLIDYNRIEQQSKELYEQYREIKKKALFVSPLDLYLKDRSQEANASNSSARTSVTSEGYVVGTE